MLSGLLFVALLRTKQCFARLSHRLGVRPSVRLSVRLSHSWSVSKRCKLGSRKFHCKLPQGLLFIVTKFRASGCGGFSRTRASKGGTHKTLFFRYWLV